MLLGKGGSVEGTPAVHSFVVEDTCVTCHLGPNRVHTFEPVLSACVDCHQDATNFDVGGVQTEVEGLIAQVGDLLIAKGLLQADEEGETHPVVGVYPAAQAAALWDYILIAHEDHSLGVHNSVYIRGLLEAALAALQ